MDHNDLIALARHKGDIVAVLERIAVALEGLFILERGHAADCAVEMRMSFRAKCNCGYDAARRTMRKEGE